MAENKPAAQAKAQTAPVAKEAGQVLISNTSMVNIRFTKRNAGILLPQGLKNKNAIALPAMQTVSLGIEDYNWLKKQKAFIGAVDNGDIVINNSKMPNRQPSKVLSHPVAPADLKPKKMNVAQGETPNGITVEPGLGGVVSEE